MKSLGDTAGPAKVFSIVTELEGHADNAAAAVFGGLVIATPDGIQKLALHESLQPVVGIPNAKLSTAEARAALPPEIDRAVVVRSLARLAFLLQGLQDGNPDVLAHAIGDELHEIPRAELSPVTQEMMVAAHHAGAVHVCWSGAGPTALAFATPQNRGRVIGAMAGVLGTDGDVSMDGLMLFSLFVGVIAFSLLYVWLVLHRTRVMAMEDLLEDRGLDAAVAARRAEAAAATSGSAPADSAASQEGAV